MRIHYKNVCLTVKLEHQSNGSNLSVDAYGSDYELLPVRREVNSSREILEISTPMLNTVMLVLTGKNYATSVDPSVTLLEMSLAGIKINKNLLIQCIEFKPHLETTPKNNLSEYIENPSRHSTVWNENGCVLINLFETDPFAYHMCIGNKIQF